MAHSIKPRIMRTLARHTGLRFRNRPEEKLRLAHCKRLYR
jgi:hypothetical protein